MRTLTATERNEFISIIQNVLPLLTDTEIKQLTAGVLMTDTCQNLTYEQIKKGV